MSLRNIELLVGIDLGALPLHGGATSDQGPSLGIFHGNPPARCFSSRCGIPLRPQDVIPAKALGCGCHDGCEPMHDPLASQPATAQTVSETGHVVGPLGQSELPIDYCR